MKRAIIYARVSSDIQRENYSIPAQVRACKEYIEEKGWALVGDQYVDSETGFDVPQSENAIPAYVDDYTSREISRPSLDASFDYLESQGFDCLVVYDIDRLARDPYYRQTIEREAQAHGATVYYVRGNYEDTPEGEVRKDLEATFAKWENAKRVERSKRGKREKARRGLFVTGRPPYGYIIDHDATGGLAVHEEQADIVRWIFEMYVHDHCSIRAITRTLTEINLPSPMGKAHWNTATVSAMLSNSTYNGLFHYNKSKYKSLTQKSVPRDKQEWIPIQVTPIVEQWMFEAAQEKKKQNLKRVRRQSRHFYLLGGMVVCAHCGRPYSSQWQLKKRSGHEYEYKCYRHRKVSGHCTNTEISERKLGRQVWAKLVELLLNPELLHEGYRQSVENWQDNMEHLHRQAAMLQESLSKIEQQLQNLNLMYADPEVSLSRKEYLQSRERLLSDFNGAEDHLNAIQEEINKVPEPLEIAEFEAFTAEIREQLEGDIEPTPEQKRELMKLLHIQVILSLDKTFQIKGWIAPEASAGLLSDSSLFVCSLGIGDRCCGWRSKRGRGFRARQRRAVRRG